MQFQIQMEHQCSIKYNNYPYMIKLSQQRQLIHSKIRQQTSFTQLTNEQSQYNLQIASNHVESSLLGLKSKLLKEQKNSTPKTNKFSLQKRQISETEHQSLPQSQVNAQNLSKNKKVRSIFQNFQKHLITTLKNGILLEQNFKNDPTIHLAHRMWNIFLQTKYYSKKILHFLLGVKSIIDPLLQPTIHPNFYSISSVYPKEQIEEAQEYLREQIIRQGYKFKSKSILKNRRMRNGEEFCLYFQKFISELQSGGISRRLSKMLKIENQKHSNIKDYEN